MPRTLEASCPKKPASCGRPNVWGPHCTCVTSRSPVMDPSVLHFAGSTLLLAGLCCSFVYVLPRQPTCPDAAAPLHMERFCGTNCGTAVAQAEKQFDCLPSALTRWLPRPHRPRRTSDAPASSSAECPASAFRQTALSPPLLCRAQPRTTLSLSCAPFPHSR